MNNSQPFTLTVAGDQLCVTGSLDFTAATRMTSQLQHCIDGLPASFTVELAGLTGFNSAVLVFMLDCVRLAAAANKHCRFTGVSSELGNLLQIASLADLVRAA